MGLRWCSCKLKNEWDLTSLPGKSIRKNRFPIWRCRGDDHLETVAARFWFFIFWANELVCPMGLNRRHFKGKFNSKQIGIPIPFLFINVVVKGPENLFSQSGFYYDRVQHEPNFFCRDVNCSGCFTREILFGLVFSLVWSQQGPAGKMWRRIFLCMLPGHCSIETYSRFETKFLNLLIWLFIIPFILL